MISEQFPDHEIVVTLSRQLAWSHFIVLIPLKDPIKLDFYTEMCRTEQWSVRTLRKKIDGMLYERTALSRKPELTIAQELKDLRVENRMMPDLVFRDPYILDFCITCCKGKRQRTSGVQLRSMIENSCRWSLNIVFSQVPSNDH